MATLKRLTPVRASVFEPLVVELEDDLRNRLHLDPGGEDLLVVLPAGLVAGGDLLLGVELLVADVRG